LRRFAIVNERSFRPRRLRVMANFYKDNDDLRFYLETYLDWRPLV
jgi:hypothetical protein